MVDLYLKRDSFSKDSINLLAQDFVVYMFVCKIEKANTFSTNA